MKIRIKLFAEARRLAGGSELTVEVAGPTTVSALRDALAEQYSELAPLARRSLLAVGTDYAASDRIVGEHDDVALIPPVSGG